MRWPVVCVGECNGLDSSVGIGRRYLYLKFLAASVNQNGKGEESRRGFDVDASYFVGGRLRMDCIRRVEKRFSHHHYQLPFLSAQYRNDRVAKEVQPGFVKRVIGGPPGVAIRGRFEAQPFVSLRGSFALATRYSSSTQSPSRWRRPRRCR